jgi:hypothetical protein
MYEQFGIPGLLAFKKTVDLCHEKGLVVIGDVKRGDIGSTSAAYAVAHLGKVSVGANSFAPFDEDICTVNPYLGSDGVKPFLDVCAANDRGIFVLVKTSNPSSGEFQDRTVDGRPLYEIVGENYDSVDEYSIFVFYGSYDVPVKGTDGEWIEGSEEVYDFIVCAISPLEGEYEPGKPEFGFLFPAFVDRSSDGNVIDIFNADPENVQKDLMDKILGA